MIQGRLRGQGEMPEPQYAFQAGPPLHFMNVAATDRLGPVIASGVLKLGIKHLLPGALGSAFAKEAGCMYADVGCMSMKRLGACMRMLGASLWNGWVHVCGCWVHAWEQVAFPSSQAGPGPGPPPFPHPPPWFPLAKTCSCAAGF